MIKKLLVSSIILFIIGISKPTNAFSATAAMSLSPESGIFEKPFQVDLILDGNGESFNAAGATASLSANLAVSNLVLGDCNFSYTKIPTKINLSFEGVALGKSLNRCTVYSILLTPLLKGTGSLTYSSASVLRYGDAANILNLTTNGSYELNGTSEISSAATITPPKQGFYTLVLHIISDSNEPIQNTLTILSSPSQSKPIEAKTDSSGIVAFPNLESGVYLATVRNYAGEHILNVAGENSIIEVGIKTGSKIEKSLTYPFLILFGIIILIAVIFVLAKRVKKVL